MAWEEGNVKTMAVVKGVGVIFYEHVQCSEQKDERIARIAAEPERDEINVPAP